ncbi:iron ABC transporter permease [Jeotgalibacillus sp. R-1-5s-1]|uniref:ABC transporter permease n=1 Tax=Jeotgalibacillus sp. R-1-5s-1 TaxID=2555897 RepID=UPI00106B9F91|nr:iron ABC transporter permease [Jeotgalibacillus sp. R-1-5s-1]TFD96619.1 iron ABC transporter permease [Jeotgalibacillus sp. R-1-5s-1]
MQHVTRGGSRPLSFFKSVKPSTLLLTIVVIFFFVLPVIRLFSLSFVDEGAVTLSNYSEMLQEARTWRMLENTAWMVLGSTFVAVILGLFFAWLIAYSDIRGKGLMQLFILIPFIIPSYIVTLSWTQLMGRNSFLADFLQFLPGDLEPVNLYSMGGMIFILGLSHFPLVYLFTVSVLRKIPRDLEWAARSSGASPGKVFAKVTLPLALPGLAGGGLLAFIANLDNFGIPAFLGIPAGIPVLSTAIYQEVVGFGPGAFSRAATLSVLLATVALLGTAIQWLLVRKSKQLETVQQDYSPRFSFGKKRLGVEIMVWLFLITLTIVPVISMLMSSLIRAYGLPFAAENLTLSHYVFVLAENDRVQGAILNSLMLAGVTTLVCLIVGTALAYVRTRKPTALNRTLELFVALPYALPGMVLALAMIFMWLQPIPGWNPGIYGTITILFIAYITRFMILQVRGSITAMAQVDPSMEEAAHIFGARPFVKWRRILFPLLLPGMLSGAFLVFLTALTELTVSSLLWSSGSETIGLVIFNFEQAGYSTYSTAFSTVIVTAILFTMLILYALQKAWKKKVKEA